MAHERERPRARARTHTEGWTQGLYDGPTGKYGARLGPVDKASLRRGQISKPTVQYLNPNATFTPCSLRGMKSRIKRVRVLVGEWRSKKKRSR